MGMHFIVPGLQEVRVRLSVIKMEVLIAYSAEKRANYVPGFVLIDLVIGEPGIFLSVFTRWSG